MLRKLLLGMTALWLLPPMFPSASADRPDWGTPTADPNIIRARNKRYELSRRHENIKDVAKWKVAFAEAQKQSDYDAMKYLLELNDARKLGFDINAAADDLGNRSIHFAARGQGLEVVQLLLKHGATPDVTNRAGDTPLGIAVLMKDEKLALTLAENLKPEIVTATKVDGDSLRDLAIKTDNLVAYKISKRVEPDRGEVSLVMDAKRVIKANSSRVMGALLAESKLQLNDDDLRSMFDEAVQLGNFGAFSKVVRKYPKTAGWTTTDGESLAHAAAGQGSLLGLKLLQDAGVKLGLRSDAAETPLDLAWVRKQEWVKDRNADSSKFDEVIAFLRKTGKPNRAGPLDQVATDGSDRLRWILEAIRKGQGADLVKAYGADWLSHLASRQDHLGLFHLAVLDNDAKTIRTMMELGLDPTTVQDRAKLSAGDLAQLIAHPQVSAILKSTRNPIYFSGDGGASTLWTLADLDDPEHYQSDETILQLAKLGKYDGVAGGSFQGEKELLYIGSLRKSASIIDAALARRAVTAEFDSFARDNAASINVRLEVPFYFEEKETPMVSNRLLSRFGAIQKKVRLERDCTEARNSLPAEFLAAQEYADLLFELLWDRAAEANSYLNRQGTQLPAARPSALSDKWEPANRERNRKYLESELNLLAIPNKRYSPLCAVRTDVIKGEQQAIWRSNSTNFAPLRWACRQALEDPKFESYDLRIDYGAFNKDSAKALSADEFGRASAAEAKRFDVGIQVAIADPEGHFVARVKMGMDPAAPTHEKTMQKIAFFREMSLDRAENYLRKQHPQCAYPVTGQGISGLGRKPEVGHSEKLPAQGEGAQVPVASPAR